MKQFEKISGSASKNISDLILNFTDPTEEVFIAEKGFKDQPNQKSTTSKVFVSGNYEEIERVPVNEFLYKKLFKYCFH